MRNEAIQRFELEQLKTREEMQPVIDLFGDSSVFSHKEVHRREGIAKVMLEEYCPLSTLLDQLPGAKGGLTKASNEGPDAVIVSTDGTETTLQIVTAYADHQEAMGREMLSENEITFVTSRRTRNPETGKVEEEKRGGFTTPAARTAKVVRKIQSALQKKIRNFKAGTDALLIVGEKSLSLSYGDWKEGVLSVLAGTDDIPYKRVYVCDNDRVYITYSPPLTRE